MKEIETIKTTTYKCKKGFFIDIVYDDEKGTYEVWIYHKNKKVKMFMRKFLKSESTIDTIIQYFNSDSTKPYAKVVIDEYIWIYTDTYIYH